MPFNQFTPETMVIVEAEQLKFVLTNNNDKIDYYLQ